MPFDTIARNTRYCDVPDARNVLLSLPLGRLRIHMSLILK